MQLPLVLECACKQAILRSARAVTGPRSRRSACPPAWSLPQARHHAPCASRAPHSRQTCCIPGRCAPPQRAPPMADARAAVRAGRSRPRRQSRAASARRQPRARPPRRAPRPRCRSDCWGAACFGASWRRTSRAGRSTTRPARPRASWRPRAACSGAGPRGAVRAASACCRPDCPLVIMSSGYAVMPQDTWSAVVQTVHRRSRGCRRACPGSPPGRPPRTQTGGGGAAGLRTAGRDAGRVHHQAPAPRAGRSWRSGRRGWRPAANARAIAAAWSAYSRWASCTRG